MRSYSNMTARAKAKALVSRLFLSLCVLFGAILASSSAMAQSVDTNAPTVLTTVVSGNYNTAAAIGISICVVGLIVWAIYKGLMLKKR